MRMPGIVHTTASTTTLAMLLMLSGCVTTDTPEPPATTARSLCPAGKTPSCVEYIGRKVRCFCGTLDDLERILEPDPLGF